MNKSDLIENLSRKAGLTNKKADKLVTFVFREMSQALATVSGSKSEVLGVSRSSTTADM